MANFPVTNRPIEVIDVYKRQWRHYQLQYVGTDITMSVINVVEMLFSQISRHFQPVSYTHLDVYKRQG